MSSLATLASVRRLIEEEGWTVDRLLDEVTARNRGLDADGAPVAAFLALRESAPGAGDGRGAGDERGAGGRAGGAGAGGAGAAPDDDGDSGGRVAGSPLAGAPVAVKDNICTADLPTTCGSRILEGYRSPYAATVVRRLEAAGAWIVGKTNCDEFAMGSSTEHSAYGPTRNPVDRDRVPGGSSGGSAAAVAAGLVPVALGSETGGSVRQPASLCGVVGVKPTYGRVSRYGLVAFASSLDQVGVLARTVGDAAAILETISGADPRDATCQPRPVPRRAALDDHRLEGTVIGVPQEYMGEGLDPGVRRLVEAALARIEEAGAEVRSVSLAHAEAAVPCYYVIAPAEASSNLARYDGVRFGFRAAGAPELGAMYERTRGEGFGDEVKRRIMIGTYALSAGYYEAYYGRAQRVRAAIADDFRRAFADGVDALFTPTTPTPAFALGEKAADPYEMYLSDIYTVSANLAGIPAVSIPIGDVDGLPAGGQLMCAHWQEERMLGLAARVEELIGYRHPTDRSGEAAGAASPGTRDPGTAARDGGRSAGG